MNRVPKVEEAIRETVALILQQELKDPRVQLVTVTRVKATADLQHAVIYFSVLEPDRVAATEAGLGRAAPYIRRLVGERLRLRFTPELRFQYDPSVAEGIRVQQLLKAAQPPPSSAPQAAGA
ncbi:MAG: 30S ribosome-binding factor RbfA [Candidatus Omnitrophica bacterium]|nr:30S ribosome-binding factor RbfA [Candidatus Omnitrophota bacterium]